MNKFQPGSIDEPETPKRPLDDPERIHPRIEPTKEKSASQRMADVRHALLGTPEVLLAPRELRRPAKLVVSFDKPFTVEGIATVLRITDAAYLDCVEGLAPPETSPDEARRHVHVYVRRGSIITELLAATDAPVWVATAIATMYALISGIPKLAALPYATAASFIKAKLDLQGIREFRDNSPSVKEYQQPQGSDLQAALAVIQRDTAITQLGGVYSDGEPPAPGLYPTVPPGPGDSPMSEVRGTVTEQIEAMEQTYASLRAARRSILDIHHRLETAVDGSNSPAAEEANRLLQRAARQLRTCYTTLIAAAESAIEYNSSSGLVVETASVLDDKSQVCRRLPPLQATVAEPDAPTPPKVDTPLLARRRESGTPVPPQPDDYAVEMPNMSDETGGHDPR